MIILEPNDKFELKLDDATFILSPFSKKQQLELDKCVKMESGEEIIDIDKQMHLTFKFCIKDIKGIKKPDGSEFKFDFDENGQLSDEHVDILRMNVSSSRVYMGMIALRMGNFGEVKNHAGESLGMELNYLGN